MSGGVEFSEPRLRALCDHVVDREGLMPSDKLAVILWLSDFENYRRRGESISGATWVKGGRFRTVYAREVGECYFERYVRERCGWLPNLLGWAFALWAAVRYAR